MTMMCDGKAAEMSSESSPRESQPQPSQQEERGLLASDLRVHLPDKADDVAFFSASRDNASFFRDLVPDRSRTVRPL